MSLLDQLLLAPLWPFFVLAATWWLPWEQWIPWIELRSVLGPYLLYASFVAWHFKIAWWITLGAAFVGTALCVFTLFHKPKQRHPG
jgi:hypothetical protein